MPSLSAPDWFWDARIKGKSIAKWNSKSCKKVGLHAVLNTMLKNFSAFYCKRTLGTIKSVSNGRQRKSTQMTEFLVLFILMKILHKTKCINCWLRQILLPVQLKSLLKYKPLPSHQKPCALFQLIFIPTVPEKTTICIFSHHRLK